MAELKPISIQQLVRASGNANALDVFVNANASTRVFRPAAEPIETLEYWRNYMSALTKGKDGVAATIDMTVATGAAGTPVSLVTGGTPTARTFALTIPRGDKGVDGSYTQKAYTTYAAMDTDKVNIPANTSVSVTNDTDTTKNGMYAYDGTAFTKSAYDPLTLAKAYTDVEINALKPLSVFDVSKVSNTQNAVSIYNYLEDIERKTLDITTKINLSKYTGANDATLKTGYISEAGALTPSSGQKSAEILIPESMVAIQSFDLKTVSYFAILNKNGILIGNGATSITNYNLPTASHSVVFTVVFADANQNQDFINNGVVFSKPNLVKNGNPVIRERDAALKTTKPIPESSDFLLSNLPAYTTAIPLSNSENALIFQTFKGYIAKNIGYQNYPNSFTGKIPIPSGAKTFEVDVSSLSYITICNSTLQPIAVVSSAQTKIPLPDGAVFLLVGLKWGALQVDLAADKVVFYYDYDSYVLNDKLGADLVDEVITKDVGIIMLAKNQYTIEGFDFRLYTESLFSGYHPLTNFSVEVTGTDVVVHKGKYSNVIESGVAKVEVYDINRNLIDQKTTDIHKKPMPTAIVKPLSAANPLNVLFIGDSLLHINNNLIGKEWLRMLNTAEAAKIVGDIVYPATFNLGKGNIRLIGTQSTADSKFEFGNALETILGNNSAFRDSTSTEPDYNDYDGWNLRNDVVKYFEEQCGTGKYPAYIYLASGVNDIVASGWDKKQLPIIRNRLKAVLGRFKQACDEIAGGNSNVQIIVMNHQFYPINEGAYRDFSPQRQRRLWSEHYDGYERMIDNESINGIRLNTYTRFVDCASSFDIEHGYTYLADTVNPRSTEQSNWVLDTVHMGKMGSCMYADALLRDFLYHECV